MPLTRKIAIVLFLEIYIISTFGYIIYFDLFNELIEPVVRGMGELVIRMLILFLPMFIIFIYDKLENNKFLSYLTVTITISLFIVYIYFRNDMILWVENYQFSDFIIKSFFYIVMGITLLILIMMFVSFIQDQDKDNTTIWILFVMAILSTAFLIPSIREYVFDGVMLIFLFIAMMSSGGLF